MRYDVKNGLLVGPFEGFEDGCRLGEFEGIHVGTLEGFEVGRKEGLAVGESEGLNDGSLDGKSQKYSNHNIITMETKQSGTSFSLMFVFHLNYVLLMFPKVAQSLVKDAT